MNILNICLYYVALYRLRGELDISSRHERSERSTQDISKRHQRMPDGVLQQRQVYWSGFRSVKFSR